MSWGAIFSVVNFWGMDFSPFFPGRNPCCNEMFRTKGLVAPHHLFQKAKPLCLFGYGKSRFTSKSIRGDQRTSD